MDRLRAAISDLAGRRAPRRWDPRAKRRPTALVTAVMLIVPVAASAVVIAPLISPAAADASTIDSGPCAQSVTGDLTGTAVAIGGECVVTFEGGSGEWTVPAAFGDVRYLVVGGGGGGAPAGGGGRAGS
jgi:hypothetical protein